MGDWPSAESNPYAVVKSADESVTSSTVLQDDNELFAGMLANTDYSFEAFLMANVAAGGGNGGLKIAFDVPASASLAWQGLHSTGTSAPSSFAVNTTDDGASTVLNLSDNELRWVRVVGSVRVGATAGNLVFRWAQNSSSATASTVKAGSYLILTKAS